MTWRIPAGIAVSQDDDGAEWVLIADAGQIIRLDGVSALIWRAAAGAASVDGVVAAVADDHGWVPEIIRPHVATFMTQLLSSGLLELVAADSFADRPTVSVFSDSEGDVDG